ncbi:MAG: hypothetical protein DBX59_00240 [Bacillota bacterium]|nr:MAG: hypothetical protein DBX59_00240 [Bacillota bacterium]
MKGKGRFFLNFIVAAAFAVIVIASFFSVFSVADVKMRVSAGENGVFYAREAKKELEKFRGKSLLFLDMDEVAATLAAYPYLEVDKLEKFYPNAIVAEVSERREIFLFESGGDEYVLDGFGFVLAKNPAEEKSLIRLYASDMEGNAIPATFAEVGQTLRAEDGGILSLVYSMSEIAAYTDNVSAIEVKYGAIGGEVLMDEVVFHMRTGVEIWAYSVFDDGTDKMKKAMEVYEKTSDYNKGMNYIVVNKANGEIVAYYTRENPMSATSSH